MVSQQKPKENQPTTIQFGEDVKCHLLHDDNCNIFSSEEVFIACSGQINNFSQTQSATELNALYAQSPNFTEFYQKLYGSFWLLLIDLKTNESFLTNDHMGIVPCFYQWQDNQLTISSSLKQLKLHFNDSLILSKQAIYNYLFFHCIPSPDTIYEGVSKLEPGKVIRVNANANIVSELVFKPAFAQKAHDEPALKRQCLAIIDNIVQEHVSENCGAFLSGGLDSSTVSGMLAKHTEKANTFSIGFDLPDYDESAYAQITAKHFNTNHETLYLHAEEVADEFVYVAQSFDEPFGNSSAMAAYFCAKFAKSHGITNLLAGDGGDELFSGNSRYARQVTFDKFNQLPKLAQAFLEKSIDNPLISKLPVLSKAASYINKAKVPMPERLLAFNFVNRFSPEFMFDKEFLDEVDPLYPLKLQQQRYNECQSENIVDRMLFLDWKFTLADNDLFKVNRMCDLAGVNVKFPLLDKRLVEFSCTVPASMKMPQNKLRHFYKESCRGFLPDETLSKSKHGFGLPFGMWLKENQKLHDLAMSALESFKERKIVNEELITAALKAHNDLHSEYYGELIWIIVVLELWLQQA